jgi:hypothetical protein
MAKAIRKEIKLFTESFDHIHTNNILMEENQTLTQETMLEKNNEYFKERDKNINQNKMNMVKAITNLTQVTNMVFLWITNNNDNIKVLIQALKTKYDEIGNDVAIMTKSKKFSHHWVM